MCLGKVLIALNNSICSLCQQHLPIAIKSKRQNNRLSEQFLSITVFCVAGNIAGSITGSITGITAVETTIATHAVLLASDCGALLYSLSHVVKCGLQGQPLSYHLHNTGGPEFLVQADIIERQQENAHSM